MIGKWVGLASIRSVIGLENSRQSVNWSDAKLKEIWPWSLALRTITALTLHDQSSYWLFVIAIIGRFDP